MNETGIGCAKLCGECRASSAGAVDWCDVLKSVASTIKLHNGELRQSLWGLGPVATARMIVAFTDPVTFRILFGVAICQRDINLLSLPARPQSRVDAARILARRTLTPRTGFDVWN